MARLTVPLALVHGQADRLLPPSNARLLHRAATGPACADVVPGMGHAFHHLAVAPIVTAVHWVVASGRLPPELTPVHPTPPGATATPEAECSPLGEGAADRASDGAPLA